jgi:hypothetical protein
VYAGTAGGVAVDEAPHGPSHMEFIAAQWSAAIATGTNSPQTRTSDNATAMRRRFIA